MTLYRFTVSYEDTIEAPDPDTARAWALEEVEHGHFRPAIVEAVPVTPNGSRGPFDVPATANPYLPEIGERKPE